MTLIEVSHKPARRRRPPPVHDDIAKVCWLLEAATAAAFAIQVDELRAPSRRSADVAFARQSSMYLGHVVLGLSLSAIGRLFHRDRTTAAHACQLVEDGATTPPSTGCWICWKAFARNWRAAFLRSRRCGHERQNQKVGCARAAAAGDRFISWPASLVGATPDRDR